MVNSNNKLSNVDENILVVKGGKNNNIIVIDPNKVIDPSTAAVADRYIKQENLILYANLRVIKKPSTNIVYNSNENKYDVSTDGEVSINLLNPIKGIDSNNNLIYKNKLTVDYTDYFTSSNINNNSSNNLTNGVLNNYFDPEVFGISNISISQNPSFVPKVTIEFIDVQGKTLFESGDHPNNPYNLFYSFPYPTFVLTIKGYYGKAVDYPLVLMKSNTKFDPESGSYKITAEFLSRTFSIYNSFLLIYAFIAPYMFKDSNGDFLGNKILKKIYDTQNDYFKKQKNSEKFLFNDYTTLLDLQNIKTKLSNDTFNGDTDINSTLSVINSLDATSIIIRQFYELSASNKNTTAIVNETYISNINKALSDVSDVTTKSKITSVLNSKYKTYINNSNELNVNILNPKNINDLNSLMTDLFNVLDSTKNDLNEFIINKKIIKITDKLGFQPNVFNIYRIIFNNIQAFLILLNISNKKAIHQILNDVDDLEGKRILNHDLYGEFELKDNALKVYSSYPNYYLKTTTSNNDTTYKKTYPGYHSDNKGWSEVEFVDEIYNAIDYLKERLLKTNAATIDSQEAILIDNFDVNYNILNYSKNDNYFYIISNMLRKFQMNNIYSGNLFRGINGTDMNSIVKPLSNVEFDLFTDTILNQLTDSEKIHLTTDIKNTIHGSKPYDSIINNISKGLQSDSLATLKKSIKNDIITNQGTGIKNIILKTKGVNLTFLNLLSESTTPISNESVTPIFDLNTYRDNKDFFIPSTAMSYFKDMPTKLVSVNKNIDTNNETYVFGNNNNKTIVDGIINNKVPVIDNYKFDGIISNYGVNLPTLTMTIANTEDLKNLIGFDNSIAGTKTFNNNTINKF